MKKLIIILALIAVSNTVNAQDIEYIWQKNINRTISYLKLVQNGEYFVAFSDDKILKFRTDDGELVDEYKFDAWRSGINNNDSIFYIDGRGFGVFDIKEGRTVDSYQLDVEENPWLLYHGSPDTPYEMVGTSAIVVHPQSKYVGIIRQGEYTQKEFPFNTISVITQVIVSYPEKKIIKQNQSTGQFSPDGKYFVNYTNNSKTLALYDALTFEKIKDLGVVENSISRIKFTDDSKILTVFTTAIINSKTVYVYFLDESQFNKELEFSLYGRDGIFWDNKMLITAYDGFKFITRIYTIPNFIQIKEISGFGLTNIDIDKNNSHIIGLSGFGNILKIDLNQFTENNVDNINSVFKFNKTAPNQWQIINNSHHQIKKISFTNLMGHQLQLNNVNNIINLNPFPNGVYIINIELNNNQIITHKLIKE